MSATLTTPSHVYNIIKYMFYGDNVGISLLDFKLSTPTLCFIDGMYCTYIISVCDT